MRYIGKSKIGPLYPKGSIIYPQIRLPQRYNDIIGEVAHIFETEYDGKRAFFILTTELEEIESKFFKRGNKVLKPEQKVLKPMLENSSESRLSTLESSSNEIKNLLFENNRIFTPNQQKKSKEKAEVGIRTRVVASTGRLLLTNAPRFALLYIMIVLVTIR